MTAQEPEEGCSRAAPVFTAATAVQRAAAMLDEAALQIDLARMERLECLADSWISLARTLNEVERV